MSLATPGQPASRLCLSRRRGSRTRIIHLSRVFELLIQDVAARRVDYAIVCDVGTTICGSWWEGAPSVRLDHGGESLWIGFGRAGGGSVRVVFEGSRAFVIERDDARRGPRDPDSTATSALPDPRPSPMPNKSLAAVG